MVAIVDRSLRSAALAVVSLATLVTLMFFGLMQLDRTPVPADDAPVASDLIAHLGIGDTNWYDRFVDGNLGGPLSFTLPASVRDTVASDDALLAEPEAVALAPARPPDTRIAAADQAAQRVDELRALQAMRQFEGAQGPPAVASTAYVPSIAGAGDVRYAQPAPDVATVAELRARVADLEEIVKLLLETRQQGGSAATVAAVRPAAVAPRSAQPLVWSATPGPTTAPQSSETPLPADRVAREDAMIAHVLDIVRRAPAGAVPVQNALATPAPVRPVSPPT